MMHSFSFFLTLSQSRLTVGEAAAAAAAHQLHVISNKISAPTKEEEEEKRRVQGSSRVLSTVCDGTRFIFFNYCSSRRRRRRTRKSTEPHRRAAPGNNNKPQCVSYIRQRRCCLFHRRETQKERKGTKYVYKVRASAQFNVKARQWEWGGRAQHFSITIDDGEREKRGKLEKEPFVYLHESWTTAAAPAATIITKPMPMGGPQS